MSESTTPNTATDLITPERLAKRSEELSLFLQENQWTFLEFYHVSIQAMRASLIEHFYTDTDSEMRMAASERVTEAYNALVKTVNDLDTQAYTEDSLALLTILEEVFYIIVAQLQGIDSESTSDAEPEEDEAPSEDTSQ